MIALIAQIMTRMIAIPTRVAIELVLPREGGYENLPMLAPF
jgi:hypothetical protein